MRTRKAASAGRTKTSSRSLARQDSSTSIKASTTTSHALKPSIKEPPYVAILPKDASAQSRIITLPVCDKQAQTSPVRYFADPEKGFYEFTKITSSKTAKDSWLLTGTDSTNGSQSRHGQDSLGGQSCEHEREDGYLLSSPDLLLATPVNPLFIILSIDGVIYPNRDPQGRFTYCTIDNQIWELKRRAPQLGAVLDKQPNSRLESLLSNAITRISDRDVNGCDGIEYCLSTAKLTAKLLTIAKQMVKAGLPGTLEERFVKQALQTADYLLETHQSSNRDPSDTAVHDETSTGSAADRGDDTLDNITQLLRIRIALQFLLSRYIRVELSKEIQAHLADSQNGLIDFTPLDDHLAAIAKSKAEIQALRSISDNISRKRGLLDDEEALERQEAKKRKKDEEEAKKKSMSQGVKKLLKANTGGMKKLSSFFTKEVDKVR